MKRFPVYAIVFALMLVSTVLADDKNDALIFVKNKLNAVIVVLQNNKFETKVKKEQVVEIVTPMFAFNQMAKLSLGKKHWRGLTKEKQRRFTDLFVQLLKKSYIDKLTLYTDETVVYKEPVMVKKKIHVPTELVSKSNKISMQYKLYKSKRGWQVYDLEVEGVSVIQTYRSQFDEALRSGTIDDLLGKIEKKIKAPATREI